MCAGVSSTQPLLSVAGFQHDGQNFTTDNYFDGVEHATKIAAAAMQGNFMAPCVSALVLVRHMAHPICNSLTQYIYLFR